GAMTLDLENRGALWILNEGQAQWRLEQPFSDDLTALPEDWRPRVLSLEITPDPGSIADWQQRLELAVRARLEGGIEGGLEGRLPACGCQPSKSAVWRGTGRCRGALPKGS